MVSALSRRLDGLGSHGSPSPPLPRCRHGRRLLSKPAQEEEGVLSQFPTEASIMPWKEEMACASRSCSSGGLRPQAGERSTPAASPAPLPASPHLPLGLSVAPFTSHNRWTSLGELSGRFFSRERLCLSTAAGSAHYLVFPARSGWTRLPELGWICLPEP